MNILGLISQLIGIKTLRLTYIYRDINLIALFFFFWKKVKWHSGCWFDMVRNKDIYIYIYFIKKINILILRVWQPFKTLDKRNLHEAIQHFLLMVGKAVENCFSMVFVSTTKVILTVENSCFEGSPYLLWRFWPLKEVKFFVVVISQEL